MDSCTCDYREVTINAGTNSERTETRVEQLNMACPVHGEPDCICMWGQRWGDWEIYEYNRDCPIHGDGE